MRSAYKEVNINSMKEIKEVGVRKNGKGLGMMLYNSTGKILCQTQPLLLLDNDISSYKPYIRLGYNDLPIKYTAVVTKEKKIIETTIAKDGNVDFTNTEEVQLSETIYFIIEEI